MILPFPPAFPLPTSSITESPLLHMHFHSPSSTTKHDHPSHVGFGPWDNNLTSLNNLLLNTLPPPVASSAPSVNCPTSTTSPKLAPSGTPAGIAKHRDTSHMTHHHNKTSVHQHADRVTLQRCWEHALHLLHLRHRTPRSLSLVSLNASTRSRINLNLIPTSPAHFPGIQAPRPEPTTMHLAGWGEGDTNINGSSSNEDDFDGGLDTHVWNRTAALLYALPPPHRTSHTPALTVSKSLTYLPAIALLASPLLISIRDHHG
ncbi:hypothetical protein EDB84DRAFT_1566029 [Lactarius hengduanensis]|nr:hypothetical protein EDB84DRAFT_1566029 [Lactarius hengduanensis]